MNGKQAQRIVALVGGVQCLVADICFSMRLGKCQISAYTLEYIDDLNTKHLAGS